MAFDELQAEISLLLTQMQNQPEDSHELHEMLVEKLNEMKALGLPLPDDLVKLEKELAEDLS